MVTSKVTSTALLRYYLFQQYIMSMGQIQSFFSTWTATCWKGLVKLLYEIIAQSYSECCRYRDTAVVAILIGVSRIEDLRGNVTSLISCILLEPRCFFWFHTHWQLQMPLINLLFSTRVTTILRPNSISLLSLHDFF